MEDEEELDREDTTGELEDSEKHQASRHFFACAHIGGRIADIAFAVALHLASQISRQRN